jgi:E3 ubiquitin-protein ligase RGLG
MGGVLGALLHRRSGGRPPAQGQQGTRHWPWGLTRQPLAYDAAAPPAGGDRRAMLSKKYSYIPDTFTSLDQVPAADPSPSSS